MHGLGDAIAAMMTGLLFCGGFFLFTVVALIGFAIAAIFWTISPWVFIGTLFFGGLAAGAIATKVSG